MKLAQKINVAIDGHSGCGKSTTAKVLAQKLGYTYIDTGAMYRAITLYFMENEVNIQSEKAVQEALQQIQIGFKVDEESGRPLTFLNDENVESQIRTPEIAERVSPVAAISAVRSFLVKQQRKIGENKGVVMDGRDIGTVVFPDAEAKFFMTAHVDIRAQRRVEELEAHGVEASFEEVKNNLSERDRIDSTRADSPLKRADDAILIDTTYTTIDEQVAMVMMYIKAKIKKLARIQA